MELWNDYEGKTVDGRYRLERLIGPKGRSAFFTTTGVDGRPAVIRLIESLNDEDEILRRWRAVQAIEQENLLKLTACEKTVLDGVHLVYAVMEHSDAELAEILRERALTVDETRQVARSVAAALLALHSGGLVHEHVEPATVVAVGEDVKLRSDLVREVPEGIDGAALRKRDAHDFAVLIQEAMTRRREGTGAIPAPFDEIVRNGRSGAWGVKEMAAVLGPLPTVVAPQATPPERPGPVISKEALPGVTGSVAAVSVGAGVGTAARPSVATTPAESALPTRGRPPLVNDRIVTEPDDEEVPHRRGLWAIAAAALLVAILFFWHFLHAGKAPAGAGPVDQPPTVVAPAQPAPTQSTDVPATARPAKPSAAMLGRARAGTRPVTQPAATAAEASAAAASSPTTHDAQSAWRVVAFTYNREEQAQHKADAIAQQHPDLRPEVFAPKGRAPYLVALGGWMSVDEASALRNRARSEGLPRDTYTQNYRH